MTKANFSWLYIDVDTKSHEKISCVYDRDQNLPWLNVYKTVTFLTLLFSWFIFVTLSVCDYSVTIY